MANPNNIYTPLPATPNIPGGINWGGAEDIMKILTANRPSYTQTVLPSIVPLLTPSEGIDPEIQKAIANIQSMGAISKERNIADVVNAMQQRGLTGSNIEAGGIATAGTQSEQNIMSQITPLLQASAEQKNQQRMALASFLKEAYGVDYSTQTQFLDSLAQLMGQEQMRQLQEKYIKQLSKKESSTPEWITAGAAGVGAIAKILPLIV